MASEEDVRELALSLPVTTEKPSYGMPGFRVKDRLFARIKEEGVLVLWRENEDEKEALIESEPDKFFTTSHYDGYPMVLLRLERVDREELLDLLFDSWDLRAPKSVPRP
ncbi:MAG TPA: MmcQ/YjbR family DNA-binding protein [Solirubrobacterales bacterium]|nr:MmcQ/YjbR family DNA-binding protein [Solirubrobacterales bacterium]